jgi:hypothetical protein
MSVQWLTVIDIVMEVFDARKASIDQGQPSFIIVEAKRASALDDSDSEAELIGQLKSYMIRRYISLPRRHPVASSLIIAFPDVRWLTGSGESSHYGCLTDGREWRFYVVDEDSMFMQFVVADNRENTIKILGRYPDLQPLTICALTFLSTGRAPVRDSSAPIWY